MLGVLASGPLMWLTMIPLLLVLGLYRAIRPKSARDDGKSRFHTP